MNAPIASPDGKLEVPQTLVREGAVYIHARVSALATWRWVFKEFVLVPLGALSLLVLNLTLLILVTILFIDYGHTISFWALLVITFGSVYALVYISNVVGYSLSFAKRNKTLILTTHSVIWRAKKKDISITWSRVMGVFFWSNDVLIVTFAGSTFIPRETFSSTKEAREFAQIARELSKSNGKSWRDEWNGKTFGIVPETAPLNLPK